MTSVPLTALHAVRRSRLLAIVRSDSSVHAERIVATLVECGLDAVEVSFTTPNAADIIRTFAGQFSTATLVGAGTVLTKKQANEVAEADAAFIVTPGLAESIEEATHLGLESFAGILTPSEAIEAMRRGATALKLFPAEVGGPAYLRALRAPLPDFEFIPVGGVTPELVPQYLDAGAMAIGLGSTLTGGQHEVPDVERLRDRVAAFRAAVAAWEAANSAD
jgi:2-dehydro-3-deoxyphosphogluconate aldolase/(4S)-4-hydroxy-2-oxoglutarate aldolase